VLTPRDLLTVFALLSLAAAFTLIVIAIVNAKPILLPIAAVLVWCSLVMIDMYFHPQPSSVDTASPVTQPPDAFTAKQMPRDTSALKERR
jgi:hypothetical protein